MISSKQETASIARRFLFAYKFLPAETADDGRYATSSAVPKLSQALDWLRSPSQTCFYGPQIARYTPMKLNHRIKSALSSWPTSVADAKLVQQELRESVSLQDDFQEPLRTLAGTDVGFKERGRLTRAAVVVLDARTFEVLDESVVEVPTVFPYIPGYLSFRELPALLQAVAQLSVEPDIFLCDGQGIAHPRRLGLASHLGVLLDKPAIGVAKSRLCGAYDEPDLEKGAKQKLMDHSEQLGWVFRSRSQVKPLFISPGHKVSFAATAEIVSRASGRFRLPEPTRLADKLASKKD